MNDDDKPNKNGDKFKFRTEYLGEWLERPVDLPIKLLDVEPPTTFEHRIVKHRSKPRPPWPVLAQDCPGFKQGEFAVLAGRQNGKQWAISPEYRQELSRFAIDYAEAEYRRSILGLYRDAKETVMNKDDVLKYHTNFPIKKGETCVATNPEQVRELDGIKVEPFVLYRAEVLPKRDSDNLTDFMRAEKSEVDHGSNHMVAVTLVSPKHLPPGTMLRLVPHYGARPVAPPPKEPAPELMERLASAIDLPIDGYMTWEGIVGFVEEEIAKLRVDRRWAHEQARKWEAAAQKETHRANRAADAAGSAASELAQECRTFALTVAEMQLELRRLRKKVGER